MGRIDMDTRLDREPSVVMRRIAEETFLVPVSGELASLQRIFVLDGVAEFLWERLDGRVTVGELVQQVACSFDVDGQTAERDALEFLEGLTAAGLAKEAGGGGASAADGRGECP